MQKTTNRRSLIEQRIKNIDITEYTRTEIGMGWLFAALFGSEIKYEPEDNTFYLFSYRAGIWKRCSNGRLERLVEEFLSKSCPLLVQEVADRAQRREYKKWINKNQGNPTISGIIRSVKRQKEVEVSKQRFDARPRYFALKNCVLDLKTLKITEGKKEYLISRQANVIYNEDVEDDTWPSFLRGIVGGKKEEYEYLIRVIIYAMQGNPKEHCMFFLHGKSTRNGKSTLVNGLSRFFGDYSKTLQPESLSRNRVSKAGSANPDIVKLKGARFVNVAEADHTLKLDAALIKILTGQDIVNARTLYKDYEEFKNNAVFFLHVNRLPKVDDATLFSSSRIVVIPFNQHFDDNKADRGLPEKLATKEALSGLLNEIIRVGEKYRGVSVKENLPQEVIKATAQYEKEGDPIGWYMKKLLIRVEGAWIKISDLYDKYYKCSVNDGREPLSKRNFTIELKNRECTVVRRSSGNGLAGFKLKSRNNFSNK